MTKTYKVRSFVAVFIAVLAIGSQTRPGAQALSPFTAQDMLDVATATVLDLTEDGSRVALSVRRLRENAETDHRRFGDPAYVAPTMVEVVVFDTRTGASDKVFKQLMNVRQATWSRDGGRLALLTATEGTDQLPVTAAWIWDAARKSLSEVPRQGVGGIAANSELAWLPDGSRLLAAVRTAEADRAARDAFRKLVDGPVIVHRSQDTFLDWDGLRRSDRLRALFELDPRTGERHQVLDSTKITDYQLSRDGSFITFREDATEKTDYDVISGTQNSLRLVPRGGVVRTLLDTKTLKTSNVRWSD
ncbi:MAG TPA: hypothetical protein VNJ02_01270, partial [Vicinamibacterales bacterium]|nr:hypothetical protein [Vicinamibacterales bacterium]